MKNDDLNYVQAKTLCDYVRYGSTRQKTQWLTWLSLQKKGYVILNRNIEVTPKGKEFVDKHHMEY